MRHLQNNHTDLVILHLIYQLRHQPFAFCKRLGCTSCASMELDISNAIITSTPWRFTVSSLEPNCGRASSTVNNPIAAKPTKTSHPDGIWKHPALAVPSV